MSSTKHNSAYVLGIGEQWLALQLDLPISILIPRKGAQDVLSSNGGLMAIDMDTASLYWTACS